MAPVVTTTSIILSSSKIQNGVVENRLPIKKVKSDPVNALMLIFEGHEWQPAYRYCCSNNFQYLSFGRSLA